MVPTISPLLNVTLNSSFRTTPIYKDTKYSLPFTTLQPSSTVLIYTTLTFIRNTTARVFTENPTHWTPTTPAQEGYHCAIGPTFERMHDFGLCICYRVKWNTSKLVDLVYLISSYSGDSVREDEMSGAFDTCGGEERCVQGFGGETHTDTDCNIILKRILSK